MKRYYKLLLIFLVIMCSINILQAKAPKVKDSEIIQQQREEINRMTEMQAQEVDMIKNILVEKREDLKRKIALFREDMQLKFNGSNLPEEERTMYYKLQKELVSSKISLAKTDQLLKAFGNNDETAVTDETIDSAELPEMTAPPVAQTEETPQKVAKQPMANEERSTFNQLRGNMTKFPEDVLFASGSVELDANAKNVLNYFIQNFANYDEDYMVEITGHTDSIPIKGKLAKKYASNWNLSVARSIVVSEYLIKTGKIDPKRLIISGMGEDDPVASNATKEGRKLNRRVELMTGSK